MAKKPDEIIMRPDGGCTEIYWRQRVGLRGARSRIRKEVSADGKIQAIWHEIVARDGSVIHRDRKM